MNSTYLFFFADRDIPSRVSVALVGSDTCGWSMPPEWSVAERQEFVPLASIDAPYRDDVTRRQFYPTRIKVGAVNISVYIETGAHEKLKAWMRVMEKRRERRAAEAAVR